MYRRAFVIVSDGRFFRGLWALLNSIHAYYECEYRVFVVGHHLDAEALERLRQHPLEQAITVLNSQEFARIPSGAWEAKQMVLSELAGQVVNACLLDADLVLLSRLDDVFEWSEAGKIVSSQDGEREIAYGSQYAAYGSRLVGRHIPYFNSGFLCLNLVVHWDLIALWEFTSRFAAYSRSGGAPYQFKGHGDQGLLNAVAALLEKQNELQLLPQSTWCNSAGWSADDTVEIVAHDGPRLQVLNRHRQETQRLIHSTGPKWWTPEGAAHFSTSGDVLTCFEHFDQLFRWPEPVVAPIEQVPVPGDMGESG